MAQCRPHRGCARCRTPKGHGQHRLPAAQYPHDCSPLPSWHRYSLARNPGLQAQHGREGSTPELFSAAAVLPSLYTHASRAQKNSKPVRAPVTTVSDQVPNQLLLDDRGDFDNPVLHAVVWIKKMPMHARIKEQFLPIVLFGSESEVGHAARFD